MNSSMNNGANVKRTRWINWILIFSITAIFFLSGHDFYWTWKGAHETSREVVQDVGTGTIGARIAYVTLGCLSLLGFIGRNHPPVKFDPVLSYLIAFFALWATLSVLWAGDQYLATRRISAAWLYGLAAFMCARIFSERDLIAFAFVSTAANFLVAIVSELVLQTFTPGMSGYRFTGTQHPNLLAMCLAVTAVSSVALYDNIRSSKTFLFATAGVSFIFLLLTKSRTSVLAGIFAMVAYVLLRCPKKLVLTLLLFGLSGFLTVFLVVPDDWIHVLFLGRPIKEIGTLTERVPLWGNLLGYVEKEPLLGYGFNAFWTEQHIYRMETLTGWTVLHSHNTFIELLLGLGIIGLILYVAFASVSTFKAYHLARIMNSGFYAFCFALLVFYWTVMPIESILFKFTLPNFICFTVMLRLAFFKINTSSSSIRQKED